MDGGAGYFEAIISHAKDGRHAVLGVATAASIHSARTSVCGRSAAPMHVKCIGDNSASPCKSCLNFFNPP
jgi:hypothetical protein